jgi:hypothetical protein
MMAHFAVNKFMPAFLLFTIIDFSCDCTLHSLVYAEQSGSSSSSRMKERKNVFNMRAEGNCNATR